MDEKSLYKNILIIATPLVKDPQGYIETFTNEDMVLSWSLSLVSNVMLVFNMSKDEKFEQECL